MKRTSKFKVYFSWFVHPGFIQFTAKVITTLSICMVLNMGNCLFAQTNRDVGTYSIHFQSYKNIDNAEEDVSRLKKLGYDSFYRYESAKGKGKWYRVYIGKYRSITQAKREASVLHDRGLILDYTIRTLNQAPPPEMEKTSYGKRKGYGLYVGFSKEISTADYLTGRLKEFGFDSFFLEEEISGKRKYRVYVTNFQNEKDAVTVGAELKRRGLISYYRPVLIYPKDKGKGSEAVEYGNLAELEKAIEMADDGRMRIGERNGEYSEKKHRGPREKVEYGESVRDDAPLSEKERAWSSNMREEGYERKRNYTVKEIERLYIGGPFSISLKAGPFFASKADDFLIERESASENETWHLENGTAFQIAVAPSFRVNNNLSIHGGVERIFAENISINSLVLGVGWTWVLSKWIFPHVKGGVLYGMFEWDDPPGKFDDGIGWEAGFGVQFLKSPFMLSLDLSYRDIHFDYNAPSDGNINANEDSMDLSGYSILGSLTYYF